MLSFILLELDLSTGVQLVHPFQSLARIEMPSALLLLRSALRRSSVPGLRLVASPAPLPRLRRVTWLLVWLSLGALLTQDLSAVVTDYLRFDDIVTVSVHEPARPSFPAVTVCNVNRVRRSALCDHHRRPLHALDPALLRWRRLLCNSTTYPNIALSKEDLELQRELAEWTRTVFRNTRYADLHLGHQVDNMLQHCAFNGQDCRAIDVLSVKSVPAYGDCVCVGCYPNMGTEYVTDMTVGCRHGLTLILDAELDEYLPLSVEAGFAIMVHHPWSEINVAMETTMVAPGFSTYITVDRAEFRRLGHPYQNPCRSQWPPEISDYVDSDKHYTAHFATVLSRAGGLMGMYLGISVLLLLSLVDALATALLQWISTKDWRQRWN
ncbi:hypothetical protein HPB49_022777 [Dermacentor silvarum]|uniref:Uncharacterized protein n=1 Tax=Dermacentor silvarum TaxID=543639 RepID=A0ACB8D0N0_DERSI|nr:hypothetical protein HPB49_022777 [Dermacentor silvarum]